MPKVSQMQGVPAQLEYLHPKDSRRHPSHCIHKDGKGINRMCTNTASPMYNQHCRSAARCAHYQENGARQTAD